MYLEVLRWHIQIEALHISLVFVANPGLVASFSELARECLVYM